MELSKWGNEPLSFALLLEIPALNINLSHIYFKLYNIETF